MVKLPQLKDADISGKKVLVRLDLDTEPNPEDARIKAAEASLNYLKERAAKIIILAHRGRPEGVFSPSLSLKNFQPIFDKWGARVEENLRFSPGESFGSAQDKEKYDPEFAISLASLGEVYVNEAFASSHRKSASIVGLPKLLPHAAGFRFEKEIENLSRVFDPSTGLGQGNPKNLPAGRQGPVVVIIGGAKEDKLDYIEPLGRLADKVLVGGRLPALLEISNFKFQISNSKLVVATLLPDKEDITIHSMEKFEKEIADAGTIVLSGPMGKYEEEGHRQGTERIFRAVIANKNAFKVAGGGDTKSAISLLELGNRFDWISVGGGAMLEFLAKGTLPGIEALR